MGAFYNSICIPGNHRDDVRRILVRWLSLKGFEPRAGPVLFDLDGEQERNVFLVSGRHWTVLVYSHYEEERRLIRELQAELAPLVYVWVYDSDVWGYDVFDKKGFIASYNSDPRTHQSFADEPLGSTGRPRGDAEALCRVLDMPDRIAELRQVERLRLPFKEDVCRQLCRELGVEVAASSYDDLESGSLRGQEGWCSEQLLFAMRDLQTASAEIDLHQFHLQRLQPELTYAPSETVELSPEILHEMKRMRRRLRLTHRFLRPVSWLARTWNRLAKYSSYSSRRAASETGPPNGAGVIQPRGHIRTASTVQLNDRHHCRITLQEGVRPTSASTKPASVFAFEAGGVTVTCTARRLSKIDEVLRKPSRSKVLSDESYEVGGFPVRYLVFELPPSFVAGSQGPSYLSIYVIQAPVALYVFLYRSSKLLSEDVRRAIRETVGSFRLLGRTGFPPDEPPV